MTEAATTDLSEQVELLRERLRETERLAALGQLVGTTAHEFNNVLTTLINYAKLGLRHKDDATREKSFNKILAASEKAARLTGSVLSMSRPRGHRFEPVDLGRLAEETLALLERELNKHKVAVERYLRPSPPAWANPAQMQQVLINLLVNARQAMPRGGRVVVKVAPGEAADTVELTVRDNGPGIPPEKLRRIFEPFYTTKSGPDSSGKGGTGLGLSACREIVEAHQGRIRVDSTVGKGTAFTLKLPVAQSSSGAPVAASAPIADSAPTTA